jgi:hypothetical protein
MQAQLCAQWTHTRTHEHIPVQAVSWGARTTGGLEASPAASYRSFSRQSPGGEASATSRADSVRPTTPPVSRLAQRLADQTLPGPAGCRLGRAAQRQSPQGRCQQGKSQVGADGVAPEDRGKSADARPWGGCALAGPDERVEWQDPLQPSRPRRSEPSVGRKARNIRVQSGKEPDEMEQDMLDPAEFMLWLKEHFMK